MALAVVFIYLCFPFDLVRVMTKAKLYPIGRYLVAQFLDIEPLSWAKSSPSFRFRGFSPNIRPLHGTIEARRWIAKGDYPKYQRLFSDVTPELD